MLLPSAIEPSQAKGPTPSIIDYLKALELRDAFITVWEQFFAQYDVLISPAFGTTAWLADGPPPANAASLPAPLSAATGHPAVVLPLPRDKDDLPMGIQLMGADSDGRRCPPSELLGRSCRRLTVQ